MVIPNPAEDDKVAIPPCVNRNDDMLQLEEVVHCQTSVSARGVPAAFGESFEIEERKAAASVYALDRGVAQHTGSDSFF